MRHDIRMEVAKYRFTGTEQDLINHGFKIKGIEGNMFPKYAVKYNLENANLDIYIALNRVASGGYRLIQFNDYKLVNDITPHIQDLIDAGLASPLI